jgi:2-polyprenyl-6-methoxyphenol hydroxylase-like FAD-dependent oxidoreductase
LAVLVASDKLPKIVRSGAAVCVLLVLLGSVADVMTPLVETDPRDQAAAALRGQRVALSGNAWYFTPPFQPEGLNRPVADVPSVGTNIAALRALRPVAFTISEYEWREKLRNEPAGPMAKFLTALDNEVNEGTAERRIFGGRTHMPLGLQRAYTPTDYRYTNPEVRIYLLR